MGEELPNPTLEEFEALLSAFQMTLAFGALAARRTNETPEDQLDETHSAILAMLDKRYPETDIASLVDTVVEETRKHLSEAIHDAREHFKNMSNAEFERELAAHKRPSPWAQWKGTLNDGKKRRKAR